MQTLVIGYGNTLRGDDGVGYRAAETVDGWQLPQVEAWHCHQLTPELAAAIAEVDRVIFVDATPPQNPPSPIICQSIQARGGDRWLTGHQSHPTALLALTQRLYHRQPVAYALWLPTQAMDYGEELSPIAQTGLAQGLRYLRAWLSFTQ